MISISNKFISAKISEQGAELTSVLLEGQERMWTGDKNVWPRHAPHLFPVVGRVHNDQILVNSNRYSMPRHGFARDSKFEVREQSIDSVTLVLNESEESLKRFPFQFELQISYSLKENSVITEYKISSKANELFYSLGAHPGFKLEDGMKNWYVEFEKEENTKRFFVSDGLIADETEAFKTSGKMIQLDTKLFKKDAIVLKSFRSSCLTLRNKPNTQATRVEWSSEFTFFGIWSVPGNEDFVCIEPWAGVADGVNFNGEFRDKEGVRKLNKGESEKFKLVYSFS